jgi:hypothetical protein
MNPWTKPKLIGQFIALVAIECIACSFPGVPILAFSVGVLAIWGAVLSLYRKCSFCTTAGFWALLFAVTMMSVGIAVNVWYFTTAFDGTLTSPVLHNEDAHWTWLDLLYMHGLPDGRAAATTRHGYTVIVYAISQVFGVNILAPLMFNMLFVLLCIIMTGGIAAHIFRDTKCPTKYAGAAMVAITAVCYFLASGCILLKDALMCMTSALFILCTLHLRRYGSQRSFALNLAGLAISVALLYIVRPNMLLLCSLCIAILAQWRSRRLAVTAVAVIAVIIGAWCINQYVQQLSPDMGDVATGNASNIFNGEASHRAQSLVTGDYQSLSTLKRILLLPASVVTQTLIPFPWNFSRDVIFGPTLAYSHVAYPYYILIFFILYYVCFAARRAPREMNLALVWALIVYCAIAYVTAGSISRYALPLLPVFAPCAAYTAVNCITHRRLKIYGSIYVCVAAIGLLVCYNLQMMTQQ